jgi:hypothetical protein
VRIRIDRRGVSLSPKGQIAPPSLVAKLVEQLLELGCYEISLGDTIGVGAPGSIRAMLDDVLVSLLYKLELWRLGRMKNYSHIILYSMFLRHTHLVRSQTIPI